MKTRILLFIAVILCLTIGYCIGWAQGSMKMASDCNTNSLMYFTGIHARLVSEKYDKAKMLTEDAVDAHLGTLRVASEKPLFYYLCSLHIVPQSFDKAKGGILAETKQYFLDKTQVLRQESRQYLKTLPDAAKP